MSSSLSHEMCEVASQICERIDTPVSLSVFLKLKYKCWRDIAEMRISPLSYLDASSYDKDQIACSLLRKVPLPTGIDTSSVAKQKWLESELQCKATNVRFESMLLREAYPLGEDLADIHLQRQLEFIKLVRKWVTILVGRIPPKIEGRPSKRATYHQKGRESLLINKFCTKPEHTPNCSYTDASFHQTAWYRNLTGPKPFSGEIIPDFTDDVVRGNRFATVPKDGLTDRPIGCEPTLNVFCQLGVGDALKKRLRRHGLLATESTCGFDAQQHHRKLAQRASLDGYLSTIDMSSASDTVARRVVSAVFPAGWVDLFERFRSPMTQHREGFYLLEKISSMGNGFTFELETALFAGIAAAAMELCAVPVEFTKNLTVYGDDVILPTECYSMACTGLRFFGMTVNQKKSFSTGYFRESCGGDFFLGVDVRPILFEKDPASPSDWFGVHNKVERLRGRVPDIDKVLGYIVDQLPLRLRKCRGPVTLGDSVLHSSTYDIRVRNGVRFVEGIVPIPATVDRSRWDDSTVAVASLYGIDSKIPIPLRGGTQVSILGYRRDWFTLDGLTRQEVQRVFPGVPS